VVPTINGAILSTNTGLPFIPGIQASATGFPPVCRHFQPRCRPYYSRRSLLPFKARGA
jgi:hypothetical protein